MFHISLRFMNRLNLTEFAIFVCIPKEPRHKKNGFLHIGENKDADQLRSNREADQRLCFRYIDSTIPLFPKYKISRL